MESNEVKISTKGQITVPKEFWDKFHLEPGDSVIIQSTSEGILIKPKTTHLGMLRGMFREEIDFEKAEDFVKSERSKWRI
jgi:AbrB family looped-hinge helix DNA binding protein